MFHNDLVGQSEAAPANSKAGRPAEPWSVPLEASAAAHLQHTSSMVMGIGGPAAEKAGLAARPLPLGELARVVAQPGCDHGLHRHVPLRVQSVPVVGGVNVLVDTAM